MEDNIVIEQEITDRKTVYEGHGKIEEVTIKNGEKETKREVLHIGNGVGAIIKDTVKNKYIFEGLYGSDSKIFFSDKPANKRDKTFTFIGQLVERKGIDILIKAFNKFYNNNPEWKLNIYGRGYYSKKIHSGNGIQIHDFKPPSEIAKILRNTRFLILPSKEDHWPLVVSESSLSGCGLILSDKIGNIPEFLNKDNGFVFRYNSVKDLVNKLSLASNMSDDELLKLTKVSVQLGSNYLPIHWKIKFCEIINFFVND